MKKDYLKYIFSLLLFGSNGIVASFIKLNSYEIVFCRTLTGGLLLLLIFLLSRGKFTFYKHKKDFAFLAISGVSMGASWMFLYEAYARVGVSVASLCYYCGPVFVMALSPIIFKEKLTFEKVFGFIAVFIGIFFINGGGVIKDKFGFFCGLLSAVTYALMVIFNKKAISINGLENSALQLVVAFITTAVFVALKQGLEINISKSSIIPLLVLGIINTGLGCYLYFSAIGKIPAQTVAVCGYSEARSAVVFSAVFLKESLSALQIAGALLIIGGAVFSNLFHRKT